MSPANTATAPSKASGWLDRFFASYFDHRPVNATFIGVHDRDYRLPDFSESAVGDAVAAMEGLLRDADKTSPPDVTEAEAIDLRLARGFLRIQLREFASAHFHRGNPSFYTGEAVFGVLSLFLTRFAPVEERVTSAIERLDAVPALLARARANVTRAPAAWSERAIRECAGALAFLREGIDALVAAERIEDPAFARAAARAAEAFATHRDHLASELRARATEAYACGEEMLALYVREGHYLGEEVEEIALRAEAELAEAEARLAEGARAFGASGSREALARLRQSHPGIDGYAGRYQATWDAARDAARAHELLTWPDFPIRFTPIPAWARAAAPYLYFLPYRSPAAYARPAVHEHLITPIEPDMPAPLVQRLLEDTNDSAIRLNHVLHHAGIGHHVQNWHAFRAPSRIGRIAAVDCASRIALFCGGTMAEGWACYVTGLMAETGFLTPLERYSEHAARARMCARAVVDVRLHQGRWTLADAAAFYERRAGMGHDAAFAEAVKNSMFPGVALMYMTGRDTIVNLRRELSARLGPAFTARAFHDALLSYGSIPVTLAAEAMRRKVNGASEDGMTALAADRPAAGVESRAP